MRVPGRIGAVVLIALAAFVARESIELSYGTRLGPGPGFFPLWLSGLLALLAGAMLWQSRSAPAVRGSPAFFPDRAGLIRIGAILGTLAAMVALLEPLGFRLTMLAFALVLIPVLGRRGALETLLVAAGCSFGVYYVFVDFLRIPLPIGFLGL